MAFKKSKKAKHETKVRKVDKAEDNKEKSKPASKSAGPVSFAKKLGIKQVVGLAAILLLIANLVLFSMGKIQALIFWIVLLVIWLGAYLAMRFIK